MGHFDRPVTNGDDVIWLKNKLIQKDEEQDASRLIGLRNTI